MLRAQSSTRWTCLSRHPRPWPPSTSSWDCRLTRFVCPTTASGPARRARGSLAAHRFASASLAHPSGTRASTCSSTPFTNCPPDACSLTLFGDLSIFPDYVADLRSQAAGLAVHFAGSFARAEADTVYDQLDLLVVPSLWLENSPLVIHEALMAGVPVVGSNIGGIPDLIQHGRNGLLFEAGNADALARLLKTVLADPALLTRLEAADTPIRSLDDDASEWERVYRQLVSGQPPMALLP